MKPKIVLYHPVPSDLASELNSLFEVAAFGKIEDSNRDEFIEAARNSDGMLGMGLPVPTSALSGAPRLKVIATISTGYDSFDVAELTTNHIALMNLYDPLTETTADMAFALIMATARRVVELDRAVRKGQWTKAVGADWYGLDVHGKTLGIVGLGRIGSAIARRGALGCGMSILYNSRSPKPDAELSFGAVRCALDELLSKSDFVCIAAPLSDETKGLIGVRELALMKPTAVFVNIARGAIVDENALIEALRDRKIYGAGLDVYEKEPLPKGSPLLKLPNVVLAPHIGSATAETREAMARYAAQSLIGFLCRSQLRNVVNPEALN